MPAGLEHPNPPVAFFLTSFQIAALVESRSLPLFQLVPAVCAALAATAPSEEAVRDAIVALALRKPFGAADASGLDRLESAAGEAGWAWELLDVKVLAKPLRQKAEALRRRRKQVRCGGRRRLPHRPAMLDARLGTRALRTFAHHNCTPTAISDYASATMHQRLSISDYPSFGCCN